MTETFAAVGHGGPPLLGGRAGVLRTGAGGERLVVAVGAGGGGLGFFGEVVVGGGCCARAGLRFQVVTVDRPAKQSS